MCAQSGQSARVTERDEDGHKRRLLLSIVDAIGRFERGESQIDELQGSFSIVADELDSTSHDLIVLLRELDADLEHIQHAMVRADQRPAVAPLVDQVLHIPDVAAVAGAD